MTLGRRILSVLRKAARALGLPALAGLMLGAAGCLSRPAVVRQTFAFESPAPRPTAAGGSEKGTGVVAIRSFEISPLFASQAFVYRLGAEAYEFDPYAGFIVPPNRALEIPVRAYLRNSGVFHDIAEPRSLLRPDSHLEVTVSELYGDLRTPAKPVAVLSMRFVLFPAPPAPVWEKHYSRRIDCSENTAASIVAGWNKALAEIMTEVAADLSRAIPPGGKR